jgi:aminoglycoside phosphotransferase (APT) family kinase protein
VSTETAVPPEIVAGLVNMGLGVPLAGRPLTGGVSSDIWQVDLPLGPVCVKRALPKLRVQADWQAPVERNSYEAQWMRVAAKAAPGAVPDLLGQDEVTGCLAMAYLPAEQHPLWKAQLRDGLADAAFAAQVAERLGAIHAATANDPVMAAAFPTDRIFFDIRLDPYLGATARAHPDLAPQLQHVIATTAGTKRALVHGDVSPKNILAGPQGPIFLDAECAWYGDPAFDLAFCLNHLLLKSLWNPPAHAGFQACFVAFQQAYLAKVTWEAPAAIEARAAALLPGLLLARVDGKSPVEYVTQAAEKDLVRRVAQPLIVAPPTRLALVAAAWAEEIGR